MAGIDLTNKRFNRLLVLHSIKKTNKKGQNITYWLCKCNCGNTKEIITGALTSLRTQSCGCLLKEIRHKTKHGHNKRNKVSKEYQAWTTLKNRCFNPKYKYYEHYGGRGITVCQEWINSFETFLNDVGLAPSKNHSIDRINNNGNYCKENCRWATKTVQNINKNHKKSESNVTGVCKTKNKKKWYATITVNKNRINLGTFQNIEDAITARKQAEELYHKPLLNQK